MQGDPLKQPHAQQAPNRTARTDTQSTACLCTVSTPQGALRPCCKAPSVPVIMYIYILRRLLGCAPCAGTALKSLLRAQATTRMIIHVTA
jgi:hypothetical protein